jgi:hypothetical protein
VTLAFDSLNSFRFPSLLFLHRPFVSFLISTAFYVLQATDSESITNSGLVTVMDRSGTADRKGDRINEEEQIGNSERIGDEQKVKINHVNLM